MQFLVPKNNEFNISIIVVLFFGLAGSPVFDDTLHVPKSL